MPVENDNNSGLLGALTGVTGAAGNLVGGTTRTTGGVVGALTDGLGETVNKTSGGALNPVGDTVKSVGEVRGKHSESASNGGY